MRTVYEDWESALSAAAHAALWASDASVTLELDDLEVDPLRGTVIRNWSAQTESLDPRELASALEAAARAIRLHEARGPVAALEIGWVR